MKYFTIMLILFSFLNCFSQENKKIMYQQSDGTLLTESQFLALKDDFKNKMKEQGKKGGIRTVMQDSISKNAVYKKFKLSWVSTTDIGNDERIETYLNKKFPDYRLTTLDSESINLAELQGKPTFITFWFTRCAPCIKELPALRDLKDKYGDKVNFVAITFDSAETVKSFLEKRKFNYKHIVGANDFISSIGLNTYPRNIILDKNGIVTSIKDEIPNEKGNNGVLKFDLSDFEKELEKLL